MQTHTQSLLYWSRRRYRALSRSVFRHVLSKSSNFSDTVTAVLGFAPDWNTTRRTQAMSRVGMRALLSGVLPARAPSSAGACCYRPVRFSSSTSDLGATYPTSYVRKHTKVKGEPINNDVAANSPSIQAIAARLRLKGVPPATLARTLIDATSTLKFVNNAGLSKFGKSLLSLYVYEHFMIKYPRLPSQVLSHIVDSYTGMTPLSELGKLWGIQHDTRSSLGRHLSSNTDEQILGQLSFTDRTSVIESGVTQIADEQGATDLTNAMGAFVRALVAAVYAHNGLDSCNKFILDYIVAPRKLDISKLLAFSRPTRELAVLCAREGMEAPVSRLVAESGRYSSQAVFVVGVFSGNQKIGEGQGNSLREARTRAAVNSLQGWYLYSPSAALMDTARRENRAAFIDAGEIVV